MKYSYLRQLTFDKLCITIDEARDMNYLEKIPRAFNEGLNLISGALNTCVQAYTFKIRKIDLYNNKNGLVVKMPFNFASFSQINDSYLNSIPFIIENYLGTNQVILYGNEIPGYNIFTENYEYNTAPGYVEISSTETITYSIWYNAFYPQISTNSVDGNFKASVTDIEFFPEHILFVNPDEIGYKEKIINIENYNFDERVAFLLPYYAASQCLIQDDRGLSMQYKNEFELYLARVDVSNFQRPRQYRSTKGLY